jgi:hypothetical protein
MINTQYTNMKAILFTQEHTAGFNALQERIHLHMISKIGVDGFHYSADCWARVDDAYIYEDQLCMPVNEYEPIRYSYILEVLTQEEKDSIVDVPIGD